MFLRRAAGGLLLCASACLAAGCAVVDQYSDRAVVYNLQAEKAQNEQLLLNVVRASLRRPMQFSTVSSITGTASATGSAQYTLPLHVPFRPTTNGTSIATFPPVPTLQFSGSASGGPAFTVPVLDTQEFYQGILRPLPGQIWDLFIQSGYSPDLLFNLFVDKIVMSRTNGDCDLANPTFNSDCQFTFQNYATQEVQIELFQAMADYLLALGLTTEALPGVTVQLTKQQIESARLLNIRYIGAFEPAGSANAQIAAPPGGAAVAGGDTAPRPIGICFSPQQLTELPATELIPNSSRCGNRQRLSAQANARAKPIQRQMDRVAIEIKKLKDKITSLSEKDKEKLESLNREFDGLQRQLAGTKNVDVAATGDQNEIKQTKPATIKVRLSKTFLDGLARIVECRYPKGDMRSRLIDNLAKFKDEVSLTFHLRSVEGMIYYLGELARREISPDYEDAAGPIYAKVSRVAFAPYPAYKSCSELTKEDHYVCVPIFTLNAGLASEGGEFLSVFYDGQRYSVPQSGSFQNAGGLSSQVLDILRQQIAINSSAKSLPQSTVISVVGQ